MGHCKIKCSLCCVQQVWWGLHWGLKHGLGRWFVGGAVLPVCGDFQRRRQHSATTAHRALPVCEWQVLGMSLGHCKVKCSLCKSHQLCWSLVYGGDFQRRR